MIRDRIYICIHVYICTYEYRMYEHVSLAVDTANKYFAIWKSFCKVYMTLIPEQQA